MVTIKQIESILTDNVEEKHITSIIMDYKYQMEWADDFRHYYETPNMFAYIDMLREIDEKFLELNEEYIIWQCVLQHKKLSNKFLDKYILKIIEAGELRNMLIFQRLDEKTIIKYKEYFSSRDWYNISRHQNISRDFIMEYTAELCFIGLSINPNLI